MDNYYKEGGYFDIIIKSEDHGVKKYADTRKMWNHGYHIYNIIPEKNCYVIVYGDYDFKSGKSEFYSRPDDEDFLRKTVKDLFTQYKVQDPPEARTAGGCEEYYDDNYVYGPNYICLGWGNDVYSLECTCLDYEGKDQFVNKEEDTFDY